MANTETSQESTGLPIPYLTAVWVGMSRDDIVAGLKAGSILPPPGSPGDWLPDPPRTARLHDLPRARLPRPTP
jgi:hypothetical protein